MKGGAEGARGARRHAPRICAVAVSQAKQKCPLGRRGARGNPAARAGTAQNTFAAVAERVAAVSGAGARGMAAACGRALWSAPAGCSLPPSEPRGACGKPAGEPEKASGDPAERPPGTRRTTAAQVEQKCPLGRRGKARKPRSVRGHRAKHAQECPEAKLKEGKADRGTREPPTKIRARMPRGKSNYAEKNILL